MLFNNFESKLECISYEEDKKYEIILVKFILYLIIDLCLT